MSIKRCGFHELTFDGGTCPKCMQAESMAANVPKTAIKNDQEKPSISLIPTEFLLGTASVFGFGATKYGRHNFRLGMAHSRPLDAALRHITAVIGGEALDPESGLPHVYHAICSLGIYDYCRIHYPELNDLYKKGGSKNEL